MNWPRFLMRDNGFPRTSESSSPLPPPRPQPMSLQPSRPRGPHRAARGQLLKTHVTRAGSSLCPRGPAGGEKGLVFRQKLPWPSLFPAWSSDRVPIPAVTTDLYTMPSQAEPAAHMASAPALGEAAPRTALLWKMEIISNSQVSHQGRSGWKGSHTKVQPVPMRCRVNRPR